MTIIGLGFGMLESVLYAIGATVPVVLIRGICVPHAGYGFLVGYFYGKGSKADKSALKWMGFLLAWLMHGLYDFSLSQEFIALNDNLAIVALLLAVLDIVLVLCLIAVMVVNIALYGWISKPKAVGAAEVPDDAVTLTGSADGRKKHDFIKRTRI